MPKNKSHNGLLKRCRVTKTGRIKLFRACGRHLRSHKSASLLRSYRRPKYAKAGDLKRLTRILQLRPTRRTQPVAAAAGVETVTQE